jgi:hypothetical protein
MMLIYAAVEDEDHDRARSVVLGLRRESLRRGAKASAAKCLFSLHEWGSGPGHLVAARKLAAEVPGMRAWRCLARAEADAGHADAARAATQRWLRLARRRGDLDAAEVAAMTLAQPVGAVIRAPATSYRARIRASEKDAQYQPLADLRASLLAQGGRATAFECGVSLLRVAATRDDVPAGIRFARQLVELDPSSYSWLAVALARERAADEKQARTEFATALRHAIREGDIHRATKATAGLLRTHGSGHVTNAELGWAIREAEQEPAGAPPYLYLRAALGLL